VPGSKDRMSFNFDQPIGFASNQGTCRYSIVTPHSWCEPSKMRLSNPVDIVLACVTTGNLDIPRVRYEQDSVGPAR
jgi:hypothetical protein